MSQTELNREVARATGETVERIQRIGFSLVVVPSVPRPPEPTFDAETLASIAEIEHVAASA